jgi:Protein of Unknown function (DUF2784)
MPNTYYAIAADIVLATHVAVAVFVVAGLLLIIAGNLSGWVLLHFVNMMWFRLMHLTSVAVVVGQACLGMICPLTKLEMWLRANAGEATYAGSFIAHWMSRLLYYDAPPWVFTVLYSVFGLAVVATWIVYPVRRNTRGQP